MVWRFPNETLLRKEDLRISDVLEEETIHLEFELLSNKSSLERKVVSLLPYRPQFILAGFEDNVPNEQFFVFGKEEIEFLNSLDYEKQKLSIENLIKKDPSCIVLTNSYNLPEYLLNPIIERNIAVLRTPKELSTVWSVLSTFLVDRFSPQMVAHGTLVDVFGIGILFVGKSGIGKSEIALDLVERSHRLVADDAIMLTNNADETIIGTSTTIAKHFMEVRGLGIIDVRSMFGIRAVRYQKRVEVIVELVEFDPKEEYSRTGLEEQFAEVLGVQLDYVKLPIFAGKNITVIVEAIALNYLLRMYGYNPAKIMNETLNSILTNEPIHEDRTKIQRLVNYFQGDKE
ncbi:MAG TPA: HPr(Ser) kinase/phosphatase [Bacteroidetes bacterium]|nr:HPr(Ser) kinase/phosphatase [Bacteroidota bacterium]